MPGPDKLCRIAGVNLPGGNGPVHDAAQRGNRSISCLYARPQDSSSPDPGAISNHNLSRAKSKGPVRPVVVARAEVYVLGKTGMGADGHIRQIVNPTILANPNVITHAQSPWIFNANSRLDDDSLPNTGPEKTKKPPPEIR